MRIRYTLDVDEIQDIIAHYFKIARKDVSLKVTETYAGYGMNEHKNHTIECFIETVKPKD
jgi:hypothetical protein